MLFFHCCTVDRGQNGYRAPIGQTSWTRWTVRIIVGYYCISTKHRVSCAYQLTTKCNSVDLFPDLSDKWEYDLAHHRVILFIEESILAQFLYFLTALPYILNPLPMCGAVAKTVYLGGSRTLTRATRAKHVYTNTFSLRLTTRELVEKGLNW